MTPDPLSSIFGALADPTRRAILARLTSGDATVGELTEPFSMSQPAISKHLKVLERAGLISSGQEAQRRPRKLEAKPLAVLAFPALTVENLPLAVLRRPPLTLAASDVPFENMQPPGRLVSPAALHSPPVTVAKLELVKFACPATIPALAVNMCCGPTTRLCEPVRLPSMISGLCESSS